MAETGNLGTIYYTVEADTSPLVNSSKPLDKSLDRLDKRFKSTDKSAKQTQFRMKEVSRSVKQATVSYSALNRVLGTLITLQGANQIRRMSDEWTELQNRLRLVTDDQIQLNIATQDVFDIAQRTSQSIDSVAQIYQRFGQNADELNISLSDVAEVSELVAKAVAVSGASAQASQAAIVQFGQALGSGVLRGEELNSVMEQTPALAKAIADGLGITIGQLRQVAADGEITSQTLIEALRKSAESIESQFSTRIKTVSQSWTELTNSLTKYIGESEGVDTATSAMSSTLEILANNIETVVNLLLVAGSGALAKYVSQMGLAIISNGRAAIAARSQAAEELRLSQAHVTAAAAALNHSRTQVGLLTSTANTTKATEAYTAALARQAAAQRAARAAGVGIAAMLGGPIGIAALAVSAASAIALFGSSASQAVTPSSNFAQELASIRGEAQQLEKLKLETRIREVKDELNSLREAQSSSGFLGMPQSGKEWAETQQKINDGTRLQIELQNQLSRVTDKNTSNKPTTSAGAPDDNAEKRLQAMRNEIALLNQTGEARQRLQAIQSLGDKASQSQKDEAAALASQVYQLEDQAQKQEDLRQARESNNETIAQMANELANAALQGEQLAIAQAKAQLNPFATPEQVQIVADYAAKIYELNEAKKKSAQIDAEVAEIREYIKTEQDQLNDKVARYLELLGQGKITQEEFTAATQKAAQELEDAGKKAEKTGDLMSEFAVQAARNIQSTLGDTLYDVLDGNFDDIGSSFAKMLKRMAAELAASAVLDFIGQGLSGQGGVLGAIGSAINSGSFSTGGYTGGTSSSQVAGIVHGKEGVLNAQEVQKIGGEQGFKELRQSIAYGGNRAAGGNVNPGKFYRVNESGSPEILNTGGKQYLMTNKSSGSVSPATTSTAMSGGVNVIISINSDGTTETESPAGYQQFGKEVGLFVERRFYELVIDEQRPGGLLNKA